MHRSTLSVLPSLVSGLHFALLAEDATHAAGYAQLSHSTLYAWVSVLLQGQLLFLLLFFSGLYSRSHRTDEESSGLTHAVFAAGIAVSLITPLAEFGGNAICS